MAEISDLNVTDASNTGRWPEGMAPSEVNDAGRADEGILARWFQDTNGSIAASGSDNGFAITSKRTISALANNIVVAFTANHTITGAATLDLNGLGAKSIKRFNGDPVTAGDIASGQPVWVIYKSSPDCWFMISAAGAAFGVNAQTGTTYTLALSDRGGIVTMSNANANTLTIPTNASVAFPLNSVLNVVRLGAGVTTITGDTGVTLNGASAGSGAISNRYQAVSLLKVGTDTWIASGDIGVVS